MAEPRATPAASAVRPASALATWADHHAYSIVASLGRLLLRPWSTLLTVGVLGVALALPLGLWLVLANVERFAGQVEEAREVSVFLRDDVDDASAAALAEALRGRGDVRTVVHRTPAQGLEALRQVDGLAEAVDLVGDNPLPHVLVVTPAGDETLLATSLSQLPEAGQVQHDLQWRVRLDGWLRLGTRGAWVLAALLGAGALLVVGNTVRLDIQSRREEIGVLQLLGATDGFIRRPFLYLGAWYGLLAGTLALALLAVAARGLAPPIAELATSYGGAFALQGFGPVPAMLVLAASGLLGWIGAGVVTGHFLRLTRPTDT